MSLPADISSLEKLGYHIDATLHHQELIPFITSYIKKRNFFTVGFLLINIILFVLLILFIIYHNKNGTLTGGNILTGIMSGFALTILLVPVHEVIHGIAYRLCGALNVSYDVNWKKLYFMAIADKFVANRRQFYFIGLAPFILITLTFILLLPYFSPLWQLSMLTLMFIHATMCVGDIALISYFAEQKNKEVLTFDDVQNSISYFLTKNR